MRMFKCDTCDTVFNPDEVPFFGADHYELPSPPVEEDDGTLSMEALSMRPLGEYEYHFDSAACLSAWAFAQSIEETTDTVP